MRLTILAGEFDGVLSASHGLIRYAVSGTGEGGVDAAARLTSRLVTALPALRVLRVDPDLVGISDIAQRTGRSRQNVLQWANCERNGNRPFPPPEGTVGRSLAWRWADVNAWLTPLGLDDGATRPTRAETTRIDAMLLDEDKHANRQRRVMIASCLAHGDPRSGGRPRPIAR